MNFYLFLSLSLSLSLSFPSALLLLLLLLPLLFLVLLSLLPASSSTADAAVGDASDARDAVGEHLLSAVALKPFHDARDARRDAPEWQPAAVSFASRQRSSVAMPGILGMLVGMLEPRWPVPRNAKQSDRRRLAWTQRRPRWRCSGCSHLRHLQHLWLHFFSTNETPQFSKPNKSIRFFTGAPTNESASCRRFRRCPEMPSHARDARDAAISISQAHSSAGVGVFLSTPVSFRKD